MAATLGKPKKLTPGQRRLWAWMQARGLNQRQTAAVLNVHYITLNGILQGDKRPGLAIAMKIQHHTGIDPGIWMRTQVSESSSTDAA